MKQAPSLTWDSSLNILTSWHVPPRAISGHSLLGYQEDHKHGTMCSDFKPSPGSNNFLATCTYMHGLVAELIPGSQPDDIAECPCVSGFCFLFHVHLILRMLSPLSLCYACPVSVNLPWVTCFSVCTGVAKGGGHKGAIPPPLLIKNKKTKKVFHVLNVPYPPCSYPYPVK